MILQELSFSAEKVTALLKMCVKEDLPLLQRLLYSTAALKEMDKSIALINVAMESEDCQWCYDTLAENRNIMIDCRAKQKEATDICRKLLATSLLLK